MSAGAQWAIGIGVAIGLALLAYLVRALIAWGKVEERLTELSKKTAETADDVKKIRHEMLTPRDLHVAILNMKYEALKETTKNMKREENP